MTRTEQLAATGLFEAMVPRYTSYPTAPHFTTGDVEDDARRWLATLPEGAAVSLYIHVPFCERLCWFCACRTQGVRRPEPVARYVDVLKHEIALMRETIGHPAQLARIHWGGGTPTILTPQQITDLCGTIRANFTVAPDAEFSVEIDPTLVDPAKIAALSSGGMNRASIGIQDFSPEIQAAIGREQSFELTRSVVDELRSAGISSLNTDIVYGLPGQTLEGIHDSTGKVLALRPDRVALFGYAHVPWVAKRQRMINADALPGPTERLALVEQTEAEFEAAGYVPIGIDHFSLPGDGLAEAAAGGRLRRNFQGYTDDNAEALIGLGASAISRVPQGYFQNAPATAAYSGRISSGHLAIAKGYGLRLEDRLRGTLIERFLCDLEVSFARLGEEFGSFAEAVAPDLRRVREKYGDWVSYEDEVLRLVPGAKPLARLIASEFDAFLRAGQARHSRAI